MKQAIIKSVEVAKIVGVRAVLIDALNIKAKNFYQKFGFQASPKKPMQVMRLMKDLKKECASSI